MTWSLLNARVWDEAAQAFVLRDLHLKETWGMRRSASIAAGRGHPPFVDLNGALVLPGLINAHDHLTMNHFPRTAFRSVYPNAHLWGEEVNARLETEPYKSLRAAPLREKIFISALKNLLSGVTTVVHHDTPHKALFASDVPIRVLKDYGWAHTLHFTPRQAVVHSYHDTASHHPWFIHLAEGTDAIAQAEYAQLRDWGCVGPNTVLIHGVGLTADDIVHAARHTRALVVCPGTNRYLLGAEPPLEAWQAAGGVLLYGSDSRLTAEGDLLTELQGLSLEQMARQMALTARTLNLPHAGRVEADAWADLVILDGLSRSQVRLAICRGKPLIGDPDLMALFHGETVAAQVDGVEKRMASSLAQQIHTCSLKEKGLDVDQPYIRKWFFQR